MYMKQNKVFIAIIFVLAFIINGCHPKHQPSAQRQTYTEYLQEKRADDEEKPQRQSQKTRWTKHQEDASNSKYHKNKERKQAESNKDDELMKEIKSWLGTPYKYGGDTKSGTDCSGFVRSVYKKVYGIDLNRSARDLVNNTRLISKDELQYGDLVFFKIKGNQVSHVGIYLGNNQFVHASSKNGVVINDLTATYYTKYFYKGGRIIR